MSPVCALRERVKNLCAVEVALISQTRGCGEASVSVPVTRVVVCEISWVMRVRLRDESVSV